MTAIRKRGKRYHVQMRRTGYPPLTKTSIALTTGKRSTSATETNMVRNLHGLIPDHTLRELLDRHEEEVFPTHKRH